jgi:AcrR family transcriptional regulator
VGTKKAVEVSEQVFSAGRFAAGEDPVKREQILDGAWRVFKKVGFDAASMNDITREAGVSKGTIYVYFPGKEELFGAMIDRHRERFAISMRDILAGSEEVREGLKRFGFAFAQQVSCSEMIPAMRSVLGVIERMPKLSKRFFVAAPTNIRTVLQDFIAHHVELGNLDIDDTDLAARQFIELSSGTFFKLRLFGEIEGDIPQQEIDRVITSAVMVFMAAYGTKDT